MSTPDRWRDRAACLNDEYPQRWWVDMAGQYTGCQSIAACEAWVGRGAVCDGCPVITECARDALDRKAEGTIRGGIPLVHPSSTNATGVNHHRPLDALRLVACGAPPADAREWMVAERVKRARRTPGHPLYVGATA